MEYFGTTPMAAPVIGIVTTLIMAVGGYLWLAYRAKKLSAKGDVFTEPTNQVSTEKQRMKKSQLDSVSTSTSDCGRIA